MRRCFSTVAVCFVLTLTCELIASGQNGVARPNIVFVLADDPGWSEPGCFGNGFNETPHLDQLAAEGMRFTQAYAAAPVCSPYRAAFLTLRGRMFDKELVRRPDDPAV
jgi:hypothetical protein